ncbi:MAG: STAS domain-containing protein [Planctomycetes bacterium]|nr:STAS domain-containing protein [Planctomycetota bacterium]
MANLTLRAQELPGQVLAVVIEGVLDADTAGQLDKLISGAIARGWTRLACDLEKVTYIASAGVGVFVGSLEACRDKGGGIVLVHRSAAQGDGGAGLTQGYDPLQIFDLLGLTGTFAMAATLEEARRRLAT